MNRSANRYLAAVLRGFLILIALTTLILACSQDGRIDAPEADYGYGTTLERT